MIISKLKCFNQMKYTLILLLITIQAHAQFITSNDFRNNGMRGLNLSLVQSYQELSAKNIPAARLTGANHGRLWIRARHDASNNYYFDKTTSLQAVDSALKVAEKEKMYLILTVEFLPKQGQDDWWGNTARKNGIIKLWQTLASRYKNKPVIAAYDLMNEPRRNTALQYSVKEYIDFQISIIKSIRTIDSNHTIAVEVLGNSMLGDPYMSAIVKIQNLIYSPHGYSYLAITHQGSSTTTVQPYPSTKYPSGMFSSNPYWKVPNDFAKKYNVPIWVGEFSCINWAPKNSQGEWTSTRWIQDAIKYMESCGWSYSYHAWREFQGWDAEYPSSWYEGKTYVNGKPTVLPTSSVRSGSTPTMMVLKQSFLKNSKYFIP
jgi:endoglucanase